MLYLAVRKNLVIGINKRVLKVMKSFWYKFSSDSCRLRGATLSTRNVICAQIASVFSGFS